MLILPPIGVGGTCASGDCSSSNWCRCCLAPLGSSDVEGDSWPVLGGVRVWLVVECVERMGLGGRM